MSPGNPMGEKSSLMLKSIVAPLEHCDTDPGPWQSPGSSHIQRLRHKAG